MSTGVSGQENDLLLVLSGSGSSENILKALIMAKIENADCRNTRVRRRQVQENCGLSSPCCGERYANFRGYPTCNRAHDNEMVKKELV